MAKEQTTLGGLLGLVGFVAGCVIGWNASQNGWVALVCGVIVAMLGAVIGNILQRILIIMIAILLTVGTSYCRYQAFKIIRESGSESSVSTDSSAAGVRTATVFDPPSNVRATPDGEIQCSVTTVTTIRIYGSTMSSSGKSLWYYTDACGPTGVIHSTQIRFE